MDEMINGTFTFDKNLYEKNIAEHEFPEETEFEGLSEEDIAQLKKEGIL